MKLKRKALLRPHKKEEFQLPKPDFDASLDFWIAQSYDSAKERKPEYLDM